ncbi:MAG: ABC transporter ATP-binding protein [Bacteroidota bacterium]
MNIYFRLLSFAKPFRNYIPEYILYVIPSIIFGALNFTLLIPLFDVLFNVSAKVTVSQLPDFTFSLEYLKSLFQYGYFYIAGSHGKVAALEVICGIIVLSVFLANFFRYMSQRVLTRMRTWVVFRLKRALFDKLSTLHMGFFHRQQKGNLLSVVSADVHEIESSIVSSVQVLFRDPLTVVVYIILLFGMSMKLTLFTVVFFPLAASLIAGISKKLRRSANLSQSLLGRLLNITDETISGARIIKAFTAQAFVQSKFNVQNEEYRKVSKSMVNRRELAGPLSEFLGVMVIVAVMIYGGRLVLNQQSDLSASEFVTYIILYSQIIAPIKNISTAVTNIQRGLAAGERVLSIIDTENEVVDKPDAVKLTTFKSQIEFRDTSFAYNTAEVLKNISFTIPKGKMVAIVGQSGAGKSTSADLLCRFYDPQGGGVFIDGYDIRDYTLESLRKQMGIVTQEAILFNDTVFNNIAFGIENADEKDVIFAAKVANAHEFIIQMEDGYQTNIGDRGSRLSGGQRQRISIARAVLKNPPILILDEATSSLDTESEKLVQDAIQKLMMNRTSLVIAHRLSTIQHADEIIVLHAGAIVQRGTHQELIAIEGIYKKLCDMQSFA